MSDSTAPKPTRAGEAPDDPGRTAQDPARKAGAGEGKPADPAETQPSRLDRTGIDHPLDTEDPSPDLTGAGRT